MKGEEEKPGVSLGGRVLVFPPDRVVRLPWEWHPASTAFELASRSFFAASETARGAREAERRAAAAMDAAHALAAEDRAPVGTASLARVRAERAHAAWRAAEGAALEAEAWARATRAAFEGMCALAIATSQSGEMRRTSGGAPNVLPFAPRGRPGGA